MTPTAPSTTRTPPRPVALITGGARRVGRAIALELARAGCDVIITCNHSTSDADATIREVVALGGSPEICRAEHLDLRNLEAVTRWADRLARELPRLDILILNASSYDPTPLASLAHNQLTDAYVVNAASAALIAAHLSSRLSESTLPFGGSIVAMCDIHALGEHGLPRSRNFLAYAMSKAALAELVRTLARELAPRVRVNGLAPGVVAWPESGPESDAPAQQHYLQRVPLARAGTPEEAARAVRWLALEAAYITGEILRIDGGRTLV
jgi:pteridine reductase